MMINDTINNPSMFAEHQLLSGQLTGISLASSICLIMFVLITLYINLNWQPGECGGRFSRCGYFGDKYFQIISFKAFEFTA